MEAPNGDEGTKFQFTPAEVAEMETIRTRHDNNAMPTQEVHAALAHKFSFVRSRCGQRDVQEMQVAEWFQAKQDALVDNNMDKSEASSSVPLPSSPTLRANIPQPPISDMSAQGKRNVCAFGGQEAIGMTPSNDNSLSKKRPKTGSELHGTGSSSPKYQGRKKDAAGNFGANLDVQNTEGEVSKNENSERPDEKESNKGRDPQADISTGNCINKIISEQRTPIEEILEGGILGVDTPESGALLNSMTDTIHQLISPQPVPPWGCPTSGSDSILAGPETCEKSEVLLCPDRVHQTGVGHAQAVRAKLKEAKQNASKLVEKAGILEEKYNNFIHQMSPVICKVAELEVALLQARAGKEKINGDKQYLANELAKLCENVEKATTRYRNLKTREAEMNEKRIQLKEFLKKNAEEWLRLTDPKTFTVI